LHRRLHRLAAGASRAAGGGVTRGFVLGKFMPPHAGHVHLCETARRLVDELTILVCSLPDDPIPGPQRLEWMRALFPNCRVVGHAAAVPQARQPDYWTIWRDIVIAAHPEPIDRLFAGQAYGQRLAAEVGAKEFILVGPPVFAELTAAAVRADPWAHWAVLPAPVRTHYARTICLHGPESTGKSVLSERLARHFETLWVPEYGRVHCELNGLELDVAGLTLIADTQRAMTAAALPRCNRRLIVDTDALTTAAWSIMLLGDVPETIPLRPDADYYLLFDVDVPWADDGTRYFPAPADRARFMAACEEVLVRAGASWTLISGAWEERFDKAVAAIEAIGPL
jgi:HTH-type transcriptional regulator, transcriptional repressor of NAD biosynthesis genes